LADAPNGVRELFHQGREEVSFRKALSGYIAKAITDRNLPLSIRAYTIVIVSMFVLISFDIAFLLICAAFRQEREVIGCLVMFFVLCGGTIIPGILLVMRLSTLEQAERLKSGFEVIEVKKKIRSRGHALAQPAS